MTKNKKNRLTLDDLLTLASQVKEWKRNVKTYCNGAYWIASIMGGRYCDKHYGYAGKIKINEEEILVNVYFNYIYHTYGLFISDKNDPMFIKGDDYEQNHRGVYYIPEEHHISFNADNSDKSYNKNSLLIKKLHTKADVFVKEIERKELEEKQRRELEEKRKKELEEKKIYEQKNLERVVKIDESTNLLKSYVNSLKK